MRLGDKYRPVRIPTKARFPVNRDLISAQLRAAASNSYLPNADKGKAKNNPEVVDHRGG